MIEGKEGGRAALWAGTHNHWPIDKARGVTREGGGEFLVASLVSATAMCCGQLGAAALLQPSTPKMRN